MCQYSFRTGIGFDAHRFVEGRPLKLGGVSIPHPVGLLGHSDADVLIHAVADACLGAIAKGDIGLLFPDSDPQFKGLDSARILETVINMLSAESAEIVWIDVIVIAQNPKIRPHVDHIRESLAALTGIEAARISVKGKTTEGMGFTGRSEGIAVQAAVTVRVADEK